MKSPVLLLALCASNAAGLHQREKFPTGSPMVDAVIIGNLLTGPGFQAGAAMDAASKAITMTGMAGLPMAAAALPFTAAAIPMTASVTAAATAATSMLDAADKVGAPLVGAATRIMDSAASVGGLMLDSAAGMVGSATPPVSLLQKEQENAPFDLVTSHVADMLAPPTKVGDDPAFATIDKDKNGRITKAETLTMLAPIAGPFAPVVAQKQFKQTDTNKDGVISYEEFMNWKHHQDGEEGYQAFREHSNLEASLLQENAPFDLLTGHVADMLAPPSKVGDDPAFATVDKDRNGRITKAETLTMLIPVAGPFAPVVAKKQFRETDTNKDGVISYEEFMNWKNRQDGEAGYQAFREHSNLEAE